MIRLSASCPPLSALLSALICLNSNVISIRCTFCPPCPAFLHIITRTRVETFSFVNRLIKSSFRKLTKIKGGQGGQNLKETDFINKKAVRLSEKQGGQRRTRADRQNLGFAGPSQASSIAGSKRAGKGANWVVESCGILEGVN